MIGADGASAHRSYNPVEMSPEEVRVQIEQLWSTIKSVSDTIQRIQEAQNAQMRAQERTLTMLESLVKTVDQSKDWIVNSPRCTENTYRLKCIEDDIIKLEKEIQKIKEAPQCEGCQNEDKIQALEKAFAKLSDRFWQAAILIFGGVAVWVVEQLIHIL